MSKLPGVPTVKVADDADVMLGASSTVRVKLWVPSGETPLEASMVNEYTPPWPVAGVPDSVAVPSPLSTKVTPVGRAPDSVSVVATGKSELVVTVKVPVLPTVKVVEAPLVTSGAWSTSSAWAPDGPVALAVKLPSPP